MSAWKPARIEDIASRIVIGPFGSRMKSEIYAENGVPVIRGTNLTGGKTLRGDWVYVSEETADSLASCNVVAGDLVFPHRGAIGEVGIVPGDRPRYMLSTSLMMLRCDAKKANPLFLYYFFKSDAGRHELLKNASQVGTPGIGQPLTSLKAIELPLPTLEEQHEIARVLVSLDDKIELNRRLNETLEAAAQALFRSWFVDFDPVRAKASGEAPDSICQRLGLTPDLLALFPDRLVESELGEIPEGWQVMALPRVLCVNPSRALRKGTAAPYLDMANMPTTGARAREVIVRAFSSGTKFVNGDTLVARITPCLENGKTCFVDFLDEGQVGWGSTEYLVFRSIDPMPPEFTYFLARTDAFRSHAITNMTGTSGRQRVPASAFDNFRIVVPSRDISARFGRLAKAAIMKMRGADLESATLVHIRNALLPKLLSGELPVRGLTRSLEEVT